MRDFILDNFGRLLAILGCSTLVTACYGTPYDDFHSVVSGAVLDMDTDAPIEGILVKVTAGSGSQGAGNLVQSLDPAGESVSLRSDDRGGFSTDISGYGRIDGVIIECIDIDGEANGAYLPKSQIFDITGAENVRILLEKDSE